VLFSPVSSCPPHPAKNMETTSVAVHGARSLIEHPPLLLRASIAPSPVFKLLFERLFVRRAQRV
jgi:hypothetical protein